MPNTALETLLWGSLASLCLMIVLWVIQLRTRDAGLVDFGWSLSIGALAVFYACSLDGSAPQRWLAGGIGGIWGFRLAFHRLVDRILADREDSRYEYLREHWGAAANRHFLWFFVSQALLAVLFSLPFLVISQHAAADLGPLQIVGAALFALAWLGESVSDRQLARFRKVPEHRGQVCNIGLWRYSRHPNYFFEWLIWCGIALVALPAPFGLWALIAPVAMYLFVNRITGIPYTEAQALRSRGDAYRQYQSETNRFFPGPWKRRALP